jgi:general secretion pathway protein J
MLSPAQPAQSRRRAIFGFTLVELMVVTGTLALMAVLSWRGLDGMFRARAQLEARTHQIEIARVGLAQWRADLDAMVQTPPLSILDWDGKVLRLIRRSTADPSDGLLVAAWMRRETSGGGQWVRWQSAPMQTRVDLVSAWDEAGRWAQNPGLPERQREVVVLPILQWRIFYFRGETWSNPLSSEGTLPEGVATSVTTANENAAVDGIRLVLSLPPGHALAGDITTDWVRPTLSFGN